MSWWRWLRNDVNGRAYCLSFKAAKRSAALTDPVAFGLVTSQFEFARKIIEEGFVKFFCKVFRWELSNELLWFISALWFLLYFTVAFLALKDPKSQHRFNIFAFGANLFEIGVILYVAGSIQLIKLDGYTSGLKYYGIYWAWILIPITAALSNVFSKRGVHWWLGMIASLIALFGLDFIGDRMNGYFGVLIAMYVLLAIYLCRVLRSTTNADAGNVRG
jgi:hypothetical protein